MSFDQSSSHPSIPPSPTSHPSRSPRVSLQSHEVALPIAPGQVPTAPEDGDAGCLSASAAPPPRPSAVFRERANLALTFSDEDLPLLRGMPMSSLLRAGASIMKDTRESAGSELFFGGAKTYNLSKRVPELDIFLSHNWSVSRYLKFLALALYFNFFAASLAGFSVLALACCIQGAGFLPVAVSVQNLDWVEPHFDEADRADAKVGVMAILLPAPVFVFVLLFKHDFMHRVSPGPTTFLDKTCIHQTDQKLKQAAIPKLGAFLAASSRLLVIYSDVYLKKLWTVYELACFLTTRSTHVIECLHISLAPLCFKTLAILYVLNLAFWVQGIPSDALLLAVYAFMAFGWCHACRKGQRSLATTWHALENFQLKDTNCFAPADVPMVEGNIEALIKTKGYLPMDCSREETLSLFDWLVQRIVLRAMKSSLGTSPLPLKKLLIIGCFTNLAGHLDIISALAWRYGMWEVKVWSLLILNLTYDVPLFSCIAQAMSWTMSKCLHLEGCKDWAWMALVPVVEGCLTGALAYLLRVLQERGKTSNGFLCLFLFAAAVPWGTLALLLVAPTWDKQEPPESSLEQLMETFHSRKDSLRSADSTNAIISLPGARTISSDFTPGISSESSSCMISGLRITSASDSSSTIHDRIAVPSPSDERQYGIRERVSTEGAFKPLGSSSSSASWCQSECSGTGFLPQVPSDSGLGQGGSMRSSDASNSPVAANSESLRSSGGHSSGIPSQLVADVVGQPSSSHGSTVDLETALPLAVIDESLN